MLRNQTVQICAAKHNYANKNNPTPKNADDDQFAEYLSLTLCTGGNDKWPAISRERCVLQQEWRDIHTVVGLMCSVWIDADVPLKELDALCQVSGDLDWEYLMGATRRC